MAINQSKQCGSPSIYMWVNATLAQEITGLESLSEGRGYCPLRAADTQHQTDRNSLAYPWLGTWAWVPKHSVGSELSLHKNTVTGFWISLLALQVSRLEFPGAFSSEGDSGVGFHLG